VPASSVIVEFGAPVELDGNASEAISHRQLIFSALRQVGLIVAEHLESGAGDADEMITQLIAVLDTQELAAAMNWVERGYGLE
jgi:hypothetical protein